MKCRAWGQESVHISIIKRVRNSGSLFQSFLYVFRRGGGVALVRISGVSVIARCPQGESRLYIGQWDEVGKVVILSIH